VSLSTDQIYHGARFGMDQEGVGSVLCLLLKLQG